ncbi:MAG: hypothetical protein RL689_1324, partial [Planctomycetota bacterium]
MAGPSSGSDELESRLDAAMAVHVDSCIETTRTTSPAA